MFLCAEIPSTFLRIKLVTVGTAYGWLYIFEFLILNEKRHARANGPYYKNINLYISLSLLPQG